MNAIKIFVLGLALNAFLLSVAHAAGGRVVSASRVSRKAVELEIETRFYCNSPTISLDYIHSGNLPFGPRVFEVNVTPVTRQFCVGTDIVRAVVEIPEFPGLGRQIVIFTGDEGTVASVELE